MIDGEADEQKIQLDKVLNGDEYNQIK